MVIVPVDRVDFVELGYASCNQIGELFDGMFPVVGVDTGKEPVECKRIFSFCVRFCGFFMVVVVIILEFNL